MLYDKINYTAGISYLTNNFIYEYDIAKCNINILLTKGVIDKSTYDYLYNSERMVRQVYVGKLISNNPEINDILKSGIIEAKKMLFEANNINDREVLSIKNDAVFIINRQLQFTKFGLIEFVPKRIYTSYYKLTNMEYYYYYNAITKEEYIDIKGISDKKLRLHEEYFLQLLKDIFYSIQVNGPEISMRMLKDAYMEYITMQLPVGYYRMFNVESNYHFKFISAMRTGYNIENILESQKNMLDISHNAHILTEMQKILVSIYFNKNR